MLEGYKDWFQFNLKMKHPSPVTELQGGGIITLVGANHSLNLARPPSHNEEAARATTQQLSKAPERRYPKYHSHMHGQFI